MATTELTKKRVVYSDLFNDLTPHPVTGDLARKMNEEAVKQSIKNLVLTDPGERPFQPDLGCGIRAMLFENITPQSALLIKQIIIQTIETYEPRARLIETIVVADPDNNAFKVKIIFNVINIEEPITLDIVLERIR